MWWNYLLFPSCNVAAIEILECISHFIPHIDSLSILGLKSIHVNKRGLKNKLLDIRGRRFWLYVLSHRPSYFYSIIIECCSKECNWQSVDPMNHYECQDWFTSNRRRANTRTIDDPVHWRIYASSDNHGLLVIVHCTLRLCLKCYSRIIHSSYRFQQRL